MPITQTCPTCGGLGVQTLGMSFEEAVELARFVDGSQYFRLRAMETLTFGPSGRVAWIIRAGHIPSGGTLVTFTSPEAYELAQDPHWSPDAILLGR